VFVSTKTAATPAEHSETIAAIIGGLPECIGRVVGMQQWPGTASGCGQIGDSLRHGPGFSRSERVGAAGEATVHASRAARNTFSDVSISMNR
jgi:hypothetical protein